MSKSTRPFGNQQVWSLSEIPYDDKGASFDALLSLRGSAKSYWGQYHSALQNAITRHNVAVKTWRHETACASNCPLEADDLIEVGPFGPQGGQRVRLRRLPPPRHPESFRDYPADQVIEYGDCVWPCSGVDDVWCLKHRQLAPELRQLAGLVPCMTRFDLEVRMAEAERWPADQLEWATLDPSEQVRLAAAQRMPPDQLAWATKDPDREVRRTAAKRMPSDQLSWAKNDPAWWVREVAAERMPVDQLQWALDDEDVRWVAVRRMPEDCLRSTPEPARQVRRSASRGR